MITTIIIAVVIAAFLAFLLFDVHFNCPFRLLKCKKDKQLNAVEEESKERINSFGWEYTQDVKPGLNLDLTKQIIIPDNEWTHIKSKTRLEE